MQVITHRKHAVNITQAERIASAIGGGLLAAIGLRITNRLSSGSAWAVTIIIALIGVTFRVIGAVFSGNVN